MPSQLHELLVDLFRRDLGLAALLLREVLGVAAPVDVVPSIADGTFSQLVPTEARTDLLMAFERDGATELVLIVEVQLRRDENKRWSWPLYVASAAQRWRCPAALLVVTNNETTARWAATPISVGLAQMTLTPHVVAPSLVPRLATRQQADRRPFLAVLSALAHGHEAGGLAIVEAAIAATRSLDDAVRAAYHDTVLSALDEATRRALEAKMGLENYEVQSVLGKSLVAKGRAEGEARGRAAAVVAVLRARAIAVSEAQAQRVRDCTDLALLERWLTKAATASAAAEVFADE